MKFGSYKENDKLCKKRLSEIGGQEIINLYDGSKLGIVADIDLLIDEKTGFIKAMLIPDSRGILSFLSDRNFVEVPWESVRKIGQDTLIVEMDEKDSRKRIG